MLAASNPQSLNRYSYVANNPLRYIDPSGHDIIIVGGQGWTGSDPYDDPSSWEKWIREYTGWDKPTFDKWLEDWKRADDAGKKKLAQENGVAIFKWDDVPGQEQQFGNSELAAKMLQKQINDWGLKDVTVVGHSKGGLVAATLMDLYETGQIARGPVKNIVAVDAPQGELSDWLEGDRTDVDATKAGVNVAVLQGLFNRLRIQNALVIDMHDPTHPIGSNWADRVFDAFGISGDSHSRPDPMSPLVP